MYDEQRIDIIKTLHILVRCLACPSPRQSIKLPNVLDRSSAGYIAVHADLLGC